MMTGLVFSGRLQTTTVGTCPLSREKLIVLEEWAGRDDFVVMWVGFFSLIKLFINY